MRDRNDCSPEPHEPSPNCIYYKEPVEVPYWPDDEEWLKQVSKALPEITEMLKRENDKVKP